MLGALKKKTTARAQAAKSSGSKLLTTDARPFIPQFGHYDAHTLLTKDGGVMQTIRIAANAGGLDYEPYDRNTGGLRDTIRKAIGEHVSTDNVAIWIHTLRKRRNVAFASQDDNPFTAHVDRGWREKNNWSHQYYNEVYITLLYDGQNTALFDKDLFKACSTPAKNRDARNTYLSAAANEIELMMGGIIEALQTQYLVHRLGLATRGAVAAVYSEPMEFLSYLLNLREEEVLLPEADISAALQSCDLMVGFNALETKNDAGVKRFGALLSLKQYREVPSHTVDMLLQAPMELIVTQAFHFIPSDAALKETREQKDYLDMSGDEYSMRAIGLSDMLQANKGSPTDFGTQQTSIMVVVDEFRRIDEDMRRLQGAFSGLGIVCIREDIKLEEIFWSTLPGNFVFLRRKSAIPTLRVGGFAKLNRFSSGQSQRLPWKQPVSLVPTLVQSPYFFNFHHQNKGHTLLLDFNTFNDSMANQALSFLLTQTHKLRTRVVYFDQGSSAELWFNKLGARYHTLHTTPKLGQLSLNPFSLEGEPRNMAFLTAWCSELVSASPEERMTIKAGIEAVYRAGPRNLTAFVQALGDISPALGTRFAPWLANGTYGGLFSANDDDINLAGQWLGIDLTAAFGTINNAVAAFSYLLHRVILSLDGSPTIIVLQHALPLLEHPFFMARLGSLLEMLAEQNTVLVAHMRYADPMKNSPAMPLLAEHFPTKLVLPSELPMVYSTTLPDFFTINHDDLLELIERMQGDVMVIQGDEAVAIRLNLDHMPDVVAIFNNDIKNLMSAGGPFASLPKEREYG